MGRNQSDCLAVAVGEDARSFHNNGDVGDKNDCGWTPFPLPLAVRLGWLMVLQKIIHTKRTGFF